eukprot:494813-Pleurochrysis_carterae.AAC.2
MLFTRDLSRAAVRGGRKMTISTDTDRHWSGSGRRRGGWGHAPTGGSRNGALGGQWRSSRAGFRVPISA